VRTRVIAFADALGGTDQLDDRPLQRCASSQATTPSISVISVPARADDPRLACEVALLHLLQL
jgi:hypothetical protein